MEVVYSGEMKPSYKYSSLKIIIPKRCLPVVYLALVCLLLTDSLVQFIGVWKTLPTSKFKPEEVYSQVRSWSPGDPISSNFSNIFDDETSSDMREFLSWRLVDHPEDTDKRAKTLTSNRDVIEEAQRVLVNLLKDLLGKARDVMLIEIATYANKGDPAITLGEVLLLRRMNITIVYYCKTIKCMSQGNVKKAKEINSQYANDELVILMQGGGNLVSYGLQNKIRSTYINNFPDRKFILFSQSIFSKEPDAILKCSVKGQRLYSNRSNLVMLLRDRQSYNISRACFPVVKLILAPDLAFCIGTVPRQLPPVYDIIWLKRRDGESSKYKLPKFPPNITVEVADWIPWTSNLGQTDMENSYLTAAAGFQFLQRGRVVVTDRLHGHILSTLMNIPHVLIDNPPYFKLSSFDRSWTQGLSNTVLVSNGTLALEAAMDLLARFHDSLPSVGLRDMYAPH